MGQLLADVAAVAAVAAAAAAVVASVAALLPILSDLSLLVQKTIEKKSKKHMAIVFSTIAQNL